ncbi:MFS transporter [Embleya scabrispora]|uniref:MFS transporter n=1 Tax=Embleya scabrispora TaxID=159449 RepID=UPI000374D5A6|nr:MFS transporter [Embleya scabrispora]MYS80992.1 MFS transporter [Streptomyces sp. SID5474]
MTDLDPAISASADPERVDRSALQQRTVRVLIAAQVVGGVGMGSALTVGGLLAEDLSGSKSWSGLATTAITLGAAVFAIPMSRAASRHGRRVALTVGWGLATAAAGGVILAAVLEWFPLLIAALLVLGAGTAANLQSRYAATDLADDAGRAKALSIVVWSTTVGAVLGPNLNEPGAVVARALGLPELSGPFLFSVVSFAGAGGILWAALRPDPLLLARIDLGDRQPPRGNLRGALAVVRRAPRAMLGLATMAFGHVVMVSVMAMTPVHMKDHGTALTLIGLTISLHVAGMYALSPVVGWAADRFGRIPVILGGQFVLLVAVFVAGTSGHSTWRTMVGLVLLGLGWSCSLVAGSALLAESVPAGERPGVQGVSDLLMNLAGAAGGAASGSVLGLAGYGGLNLVAGFLTAPVLCVAAGFALGRSRRPAG